jgi:hypothetical protein
MTIERVRLLPTAGCLTRNQSPSKACRAAGDRKQSVGEGSEAPRSDRPRLTLNEEMGTLQYKVLSSLVA